MRGEHGPAIDERSGSPAAFGQYEQVVDERLSALLAALSQSVRAEIAPLEEGESHAVLAQHLSGLLAHALACMHGPEKLSKQIALCNRVVRLLSERSQGAVQPDQAVAPKGEQLLSLWPRLHQSVSRPETPLAASCLLTGTRLDPSLVSQLRKELLACDRVDILCAFIKWSGIRVLDEELRACAAAGKPVRVITTSYMGATDPRAVEFLAALPNVELRVSYDTRRTRLHAKAYLFHRETGFSTAYIGSSNLSNAALTDGLEWNVKVSEYESPHLWAKVCATFDTYWSDDEFVPYTAEERERLRSAVCEERAGYSGEAPAFHFDIRPYPFQQEILDRLAAERTLHGRARNLVVAATGTGKTVIAAFDYRRFAEAQLSETGRPTRLLFVAHREEILKQSLACFRGVLKDQNLGDLWVGQYRPESYDHLFVSIQTLHSQALWQTFAPDYYDFVVVDEFHHAEAPSYRRLLEWAEPRVLLGLTATPERADSLDVLRHFGGHIAAEMRLPDAINRKLLAPFQYFGISDSVDLSGLAWQRGGYVPSELEEVYTGNHQRAALVVKALHEKLLDVHEARGLGFCVSVRHAEYMAGFFSRAGVPSEALSANTPPELRRGAQQRLERREINFLFVVDLYNEGVDLPWADTVLLLRPTESLTVFLQQLGRGLRLHPDKDCLTVLDFIGQARREYSFEMRFRALMDRPRHRIDQEIEAGCPRVPLGCVIRLERQAMRHVLDNIRSAVRGGRQFLVARIRTFQADTGRLPSLGAFLEHYGLYLDDSYRRGSWSRLCALAGVRPAFADPDEERLTKGLRRIAHIDGWKQIEALLSLLRQEPAVAEKRAGTDRAAAAHLRMLHVSLWGERSTEYPAGSLARLRQNPVLLTELLALLDYRLEGIGAVAPELDMPFACPLELHAHYTRDEVLAAFGVAREVREGVLYLPDLPADLLFITLNKTERDYSPTTLYEDYAESAEVFHWQSQSTTSAASPTGQRYVHHEEQGSSVLLFVREDKSREGQACPYCFIGPARYLSHVGSRPMSIRWQLQYPLPARLVPSAVRMVAS